MLPTSGHSKEMLSDDEPMKVDNTPSTTDALTCVTFDCPENHCIMQFRREDRLNVHRLLGLHKTRVPSLPIARQSHCDVQGWTGERDEHKQVPHLSANSSAVSSATSIRCEVGF
jgi:hypothetical protein